MLASNVLDLAVGLVLVFAVTAALASTITELIARFLALRATFLLRGLQELLDPSPSRKLSDAGEVLSGAKAAYEAFRGAVIDTAVPSVPPQPLRAASVTRLLMGGPILGNQGVIGQASTESTKPTRQKLRHLPSYISPRAFATGVINLLIPDPNGVTDLGRIKSTVALMEPSTLKSALLTFLATADDDVAKFRTQLEQWYDDHMARVSGWYKRHMSWITLGVGLVLILLLNINSLTIAQTLYGEADVRAAVGAVVTTTEGVCETDESRVACLERVRNDLSAIAAAGLPIGWRTVPACVQSDCSVLERVGLIDPRYDGWQQSVHIIGLLLGFALTALALVPGARFWFDILGRMGTLRAAGPKPPPASS